MGEIWTSLYAGISTALLISTLNDSRETIYHPGAFEHNYGLAVAFSSRSKSKYWDRDKRSIWLLVEWAKASKEDWDLSSRYFASSQPAPHTITSVNRNTRALFLSFKIYIFILYHDAKRNSGWWLALLIIYFPKSCLCCRAKFCSSPCRCLNPIYTPICPTLSSSSFLCISPSPQCLSYLRAVWSHGLVKELSSKQLPSFSSQFLLGENCT